MSSVAQTNPPKPKFHLLAELFPEIEKGTPAYEQFKADIKANGVREPIWTRKLPDGTIQILDGKNRGTWPTSSAFPARRASTPETKRACSTSSFPRTYIAVNWTPRSAPWSRRGSRKCGKVRAPIFT